MARQRHWQNRGQGAECSFVTTTVLDFVHALSREEIRDALTEFLFRFCRRERARLDAYVVMTHHLHALITPRPNHSISDLMSAFKSRSALLLRPMLTAAEESGFDMQCGLNKSMFWKRSFRGLVVDTEKVFWQKVSYIHFNPVKSEFAEQEVDYRWSSAWMFERGLWNEERGLLLDVAFPC